MKLSGNGARVFNDVSINIPSSSSITLLFNGETFDDGSHHNAVNPERLTANATGVYFIQAQVLWSANEDGNRVIQIRHHSGEISGLVAVSIVPACILFGNSQEVGTLYKCAAGDYFTVEAFQTSGSSLQAVSTHSSVNKYSPDFMIIKLG